MLVTTVTPLRTQAGSTSRKRRFEQRVVAMSGLAHAAQLRQCDGLLGQAFEHQHIELAALGERARGIDTVSGVARAGADAKGVCCH